jgi:hypothetical protein
MSLVLLGLLNQVTKSNAATRHDRYFDPGAPFEFFMNWTEQIGRRLAIVRNCHSPALKRQ